MAGRRSCRAFSASWPRRAGRSTSETLLQERLARLDPLAAKYLIKIITGDLRIGLKEGLVEEALAAAFARPAEAIREANMLSGDLGATARAARDGTLETARAAHRSTRSTSCSRAPSRRRRRSSSGWAIPIWVEEKYDGIRCQVHKEGERVEFYSRELRRITGQFPDLADAGAENSRRLHRRRRAARVAGRARAALRGIAKAARAQGRRFFPRRGDSGLALALRSARPGRADAC